MPSESIFGFACLTGTRYLLSTLLMRGLKTPAEKFFLGFIRLHILHHAKQKPIFGLWMMDELARHGYSVSPGTIYPILHNLESDGYLKSTEKNIHGKIRKYYSITNSGSSILKDGTDKARELLSELME